MMNHKWYVLLLLLIFSYPASGQEDEIKKVIDKMFQSMYDRDTAALRSCFIPAAQLLTYSYDAQHNPRAKAETVNHFVSGISTIGDAKFEERLKGFQYLVDEGVASVWTPYEFYFEKKFSHCGVNSFQLIKVQGTWKIASLADTRRRENCPAGDSEISEIDSLMNAWHHAAAVADEDQFFGRMTADGIYIGTDATERWLRDELREWSKKFFDRDAAWDFKTLSRNVRMGPGGQIAWFDELLDTWMGTCRSTGILTLEDGEWKISHYHLSIAVPNEKLDGFRALIGKE